MTRTNRHPHARTLFALLAAFVLLFASLALGGCANEEQRLLEELDDAIHDVENALARYLTVDSAGTAEEVARVTSRVVTTWETVREKAEGIDGVDLSEAEAALADLVRATDELDPGLSAPAAVAAIQPQIDAFDEAVEEVDESLGLH